MEPMPQATFTSGEALRFGWQKTLANLKPLLILGVAAGFLGLLHQALTGSSNGGATGRWLLAIPVQLTQFAVTVVMLRAALRLHDGQPFELSRAQELLAGYWSYLLTALLQGLIVIVGLVLLVVPGVIWALKYGLATWVAVDQRLEPLEALRESARLTDGIKGRLLGFALVMLGVNLLGALACGVGLLLTIPTTCIATTHVYRALQVRAATRSRPTPTIPFATPEVQS
jgi:hypothetical protein